MQDRGCGKEAEGDDLGGGPAGGEVVGLFAVEEGQQVFGLGVVLGSHPQFVVGV